MEKRKSHNQLKEVLFGALGILGVIINLLGVYFLHIFGIVLGFYVISMVRKDKEFGLKPSELGKVLGWISLSMGFGAIIYGSFFSLQEV